MAALFLTWSLRQLSVCGGLPRLSWQCTAFCFNCPKLAFWRGDDIIGIVDMFLSLEHQVCEIHLAGCEKRLRRR